MQGLIIENISNQYMIEVNKDKEISIYKAVARGKFKLDDISPVVGDFVEIEILDEEKKEAVINQINERNVYIKRPKLANITQIVFVVSSIEPKPDLLMLDKQLAFAEYLGIKSVIILNKTDLDKNQDFKKIKAQYEKIGYTVIETNAREKNTVELLKKQLKDNINAFSGNSGVGKSTLINSIFSETITQEGEISKKNKRGKNTTTSTKLYKIDDNTYIADTPGFSTFSIEEIKSNELAKFYKEFKKEIQNCEFVGCTHIKEENCGIKNAVSDKKVENERYERFCKVYEDLKNGEERKKW